MRDVLAARFMCWRDANHPSLCSLRASAQHVGSDASSSYGLQCFVDHHIWDNATDKEVEADCCNEDEEVCVWAGVHHRKSIWTSCSWLHQPSQFPLHTCVAVRRSATTCGTSAAGRHVIIITTANDSQRTTRQ